MEIKYSLSILFSNMSYVFKILLWLLVSFLLSVAIGFAIINPVWVKLSLLTDAPIYYNEIISIFNNMLFNGISFRVNLGVLIDNFSNLINEISKESGLATGLSFELIFVNLLCMFLFGITFLPTSDIVDKLMTSNLRYGLASNIALNFRKACLFSFEYSIISLPFNFARVSLVMLVFLKLYPIIGFFTFVIGSLIFIAITTTKNLLFAGWLPRLIYNQDEKMLSSFSRSLYSVNKNIKGLIKSVILLLLAVYFLGFALFDITCGFIFLLLIPVYYFTLRTIELVSYFKEKQFSFYIDSINVINTVEFGYRKDNQDEEE